MTEGSVFSKTAVAARRKKFEKQQFIKDYKPQSSFMGRLAKGLWGTAKNLWRIPQVIGETVAKSAVDTGLVTPTKSGRLDWHPKKLIPDITGQSFIQNLSGLRDQKLTKATKELMDKKLSTFQNFGQFQSEPNFWVDVVNKFLMDSMIGGTGKYFSDPKGRWDQFIEDPAAIGLEDLANIFIGLAPLRVAGLGSKAAMLSRYGKLSKHAPKHVLNPVIGGATGVAKLGKYGQLTAFGKATEPIVKAIGRGRDAATKFVKGRGALMEMITKLYESQSQTKSGLFGKTSKKEWISKVMKDLEGIPNRLKVEAITAYQELSPFKYKGVYWGSSSPWKGSKVPGVQKLIKHSESLRATSNKMTKSILAKGYLGPSKIVKGKFVTTGKYAKPINEVLRSKFQNHVTEFGLSAEEIFKMGVRPEHFYQMAKSAKAGTRMARHAKKISGGVRTLKRTKVGPLQARTSLDSVWADANLLRIPQGHWRVIHGKLMNSFLEQVKRRFAKVVKNNKILPGYKEVDKYLFKNLQSWHKNPLLGGTSMSNPKIVQKAKQLAKQKGITFRQALRKSGYQSGPARYQVPDFVHTELNNVMNAPGSFEKFMRASFDKGTGVWKMSVLALSPRWLLNNIAGNAVLNLLGNVMNPAAYMKAFTIMRQAKKLAVKKRWPLMRAYKKLGIDPKVLESGFYKGEVGVALGKTKERGISFGDIFESQGAMSLKKYTGYSAVKTFATKMYNINSEIESFFRAAHYLDKFGFTVKAGKKVMKFGKGYTKTQAIKSVNKFLFKYSNMSFVEKSIIRRLDPFWAWHKNIIRLAMTYPIQHPMRAALIAKANMLIQDDIDYRFVQDWVRGLMPIGAEQADGTQKFLSTAGMNPLSDVFQGVGALHPLIKMIIERSTGTNIFKGRGFSSPYPIIEGGVERNALPSVWRHLAMQFPQARTIENMIRPYAKYDTGQAMLNRDTGQPLYPKNRWFELLKTLGISISPYNIKEMEEKGADRALRAWRQKNKYDELNRGGF